MKSTRRKRHGRRGTMLRFERLEDRSMLAVAAFSVNLYRDAGGVPGGPIADDTVEVGETFFAEIMARELDPLVSGLQGVALDIAWDPSVLEEIDTPFQPRNLITADLPLFTTGTLDNEAGRIVDVGGSAFPASDTGRAIGNLVPERFALLHFRAVGAADESSFSMKQGASRIATMPVSSLTDGDLDFESQTITVRAEKEPPPAKSVLSSEPSAPEPPGSAASGELVSKTDIAPAVSPQLAELPADSVAVSEAEGTETGISALPSQASSHEQTALAVHLLRSPASEMGPRLLAKPAPPAGEQPVESPSVDFTTRTDQPPTELPAATPPDPQTVPLRNKADTRGERHVAAEPEPAPSVAAQSDHRVSVPAGPENGCPAADHSFSHFLARLKAQYGLSRSTAIAAIDAIFGMDAEELRDTRAPDGAIVGSEAVVNVSSHGNRSRTAESR